MKKQGRSLRDYVRAGRVKKCIVCQKVPAELLEQVRASYRTQKVPINVALAWLRTEHGITITQEQWSLHARGQHK
jgi:hypothetical protein